MPDRTAAPQPFDRSDPFDTPAQAALALLSSGTRLSRKAGAFLGQTVVDQTPLTAAQRDWIDGLLERADLPPLGDQ